MRSVTDFGAEPAYISPRKHGRCRGLTGPIDRAGTGATNGAVLLTENCLFEGMRLRPILAVVGDAGRQCDGSRFAGSFDQVDVSGVTIGLRPGELGCGLE